MVQEVAKIIAKLQEGKWEDHSLPLLISAQGKLSSYQSNIASLVANARKEKEMKELYAKQKEADSFIEYRKNGETVKDSEAYARLEAIESRMRAIDAEEVYLDLKGVLDAMQSLLVACQVTIREMSREINSSGYQVNN